MPKTVRPLSPPVLPDMALERFEVNKVIDNAMKKDVVYIHAPAGFGKTISMSIWLAKKQLPAAWIPLTVYDDTPSTFCRYLLMALSGFDTQTVKYASEAFDNPGFDSAPFEYLFKFLSLIADVNSGGTIVMDDFHLIQNETILKALPMIIKKLSPIYKFVILSRLKPPEFFSDMAIKNLIGEVTENDLRFTKTQIVRLYRSHGIELSLIDAAEIETQTGGWSLGLGVRLIPTRAGQRESLCSGASGEHYINKYLKNEIWDKWDDRTKEFLVRTSILEDLPPELCDKLCNGNSKKILSELMNSSGLVVRLSDNSFRYHHILRDFLRQMANDLCINLSSYYIIAADYMYEHRKIPEALEYYMKCGDSAALNDFLYKIADYNSINSSTEDLYSSINNLILTKIPIEIIEHDLSFLLPSTWVGIVSGNLENLKLWFSRLQNYIDNGINVGPRLFCGALFFQFLNPFIDTREINTYDLYDEIAFESLPTLTITSNLPFLHRSHRDYSDIANDWEEVIPMLVERFKVMVGNILFLYLDGVASGLLYEQNKLTRAREYALKANSQLTDNIHPEIWFAVQMHMASIFFAEADEKSAWDIICEAQRTMEKKNALYLTKNLYAIITKYRLYKGDTEAAKEWLSSYIVSNTNQVTLFQIYQVLTTIRAKISLGEFASAYILLSNAEKIAVDYRRPLDQIEIHILRAIAYWEEKQRTYAISSIEKAVSLAKPYGYIRIFANEGAEIVPILQKLYNKILRKSEGPDLSIFIRELILCAMENSASNPGITSGLEEKPIKLSKQQMHMLLLIAVGKNNRQICEETGLKLNTVKAHLYKLYEKLETKNASETVLKAYRLEILEKKE